MDIADEFALFQLYLAQIASQETEEDYDNHVLACAGLILHGIEESQQLRAERRTQRRQYLTRRDLLPDPRRDTPWQVLYAGQNDRAFITTMGFDVASFNSILDQGFQRLWNSLAIPRRETHAESQPRLGRRSLDAEGALGLILHYVNSTMLDISLVQIFALIPSTVSRYIKFCSLILLLTLRVMEDARIKWLRGDEFQENNDLIVARHPLLDGAFESMDGLNLAVQTSQDQEIENATYNGWLHEHFVSSVFVFGATGD